ncbi:MAG: hypothetical protein M1833_007412 [Piccolia ochrophora]|nr:MAG: hypothetical protein M1833_007412 [Piccolia ochrophora]
MAARDDAPYASQDVQEVAQLIRSLENHTKKAQGGKKAFTCKKTTFTLPGQHGLKVDSWRFQDWDYKRPDLPVYARGLFTHCSVNEKPEIVVRGYDKFFNTEEVNKTKWRNIELNTRGPYELGVKENGCIIFITGMPDDTLLVCSKHSTGARQDADLSHAVAGERWVHRQMQAVGRTTTDLARELRQRNVTAVAELCDDSFEEHVLAYEQDRAGLYLHGINLNLPEFATYPGHLVHEFAEKWGFMKTEYLVKDEIDDVRTFLEGIAETGAWQGKDVEGFVIRCEARDGAAGPWHDWFFKYKFEEPYLMYRQWREMTKAIIAGRPPKFKKHKKATEEYLLYARRQLSQNPTLGKEFNQNHGIIAMRDGFLHEKGMNGSEIVRQGALESGDDTNEVSRNIVLVPVATIGCGKTTVAVALQKLFGWGHVQNDNINTKRNRPQQFATLVCAGLAANNVVIADRNNHQRRERKQIIEDVARTVPEARLVALHYVHEREGTRKDAYHNQIRRVTRERVLARGDNHQTIQAASKDPIEITGIMDGFLHRFEPVAPQEEPDDGFDSVIDLDVMSSSRENLETVISQLHSLYPKLFEEMPTGEDLDGAIDAALRDYQPDSKHEVSSSKKWSKAGGAQSAQNGAESWKPNAKNIEYFRIRLPTQQINNFLETEFSRLDPTSARFYRQLQQSRRVQPAFHVTLAHSANKNEFPEVWQRYMDRLTEAVAGTQYGAAPAADPEIGTFRVEIERILWDDRVMCIVVRLLDAYEKGFDCTNDIPHVTVGTANPNIKPKESNELLAAWLIKGSGVESGMGELVVEKKVVLEGSVQAVIRRR